MCHGCFSLQILIEGMIGSSYKGDISIDDISFTPECQPEIGKLLVTGYYQFMNNIFPWIIVIYFHAYLVVTPTSIPNPCSNNGFMCKGSKLCISASKKCDFKNDCNDFSDESADVCGTPCLFDNSSCGWKETKLDNFDWTRFHGCTANSRTCQDAKGNSQGMI